MTQGSALCTSILSRLASGSEPYLCSSLRQQIILVATNGNVSVLAIREFEDCFKSNFLPEDCSPGNALGSFAAAITAPQFLDHDTADGLDGQRHVCLTELPSSVPFIHNLLDTRLSSLISSFQTFQRHLWSLSPTQASLLVTQTMVNSEFD
jgi:hypothetical protein